MTDTMTEAEIVDDGRCPECGEDEMDGARCYYCGFHLQDRIDSDALADLIAMDADLIAAAEGEG